MTLSALVVICTKDRPGEIHRCLAALSAAGCPYEILVVDASADEMTHEIIAKAATEGARVRDTRVAPGLAAQRNLGIEMARAAGVDVIVFVDDDVIVEQGSIAQLLEALEHEPTLAAVGPVVVDEPTVRAVTVKSLFRLWSRKPGVVLPSGRNVLGHLPSGPLCRRVQWLSTCTVAIRLESLGDLRFDERLAGYSYGEDVDLTFRLSRRGALAVTARARVRHRPSPLGRPSRSSLARRRTQLLHAWVVEHEADGMHVAWFWWSIFGELLLLSVRGLKAREAWSEARGVIAGAAAILHGKSSRTVLD